MTKKSWKPVRRGGVYCSPACGRGCTKAEYDEANSKAKKLLARMSGKGWKILVHENLGWFYQVRTNHLQVQEYAGRFLCLVSPEAGGLLPPSPVRKSFGDPNRAVDEEVKNVLKDIARMAKAAEAISKSVKEARG